MIIYVVLKNLQIHGYLNGIYDALYTAFIVILLADIAVMAYVYRSYFGRNILHELSPDTEKKEEWYYDPETHKYSNHLPLEAQLAKDLKEEKAHEEYKIQKELLAEQITEFKEAHITKMETAKIIEDKNRIRAATKIQQWWRKHLYEPGHGTLYLKSQQHFEENKTAS
jgi:hypothetical protein